METATEKGSNGGVFGHENRSLLRLPDQGHWRALAGHFWGIGGHWPQFSGHWPLFELAKRRASPGIGLPRVPSL